MPKFYDLNSNRPNYGRIHYGVVSRPALVGINQIVRSTFLVETMSEISDIEWITLELIFTSDHVLKITCSEVKASYLLKINTYGLLLYYWIIIATK